MTIDLPPRKGQCTGCGFVTKETYLELITIWDYAQRREIPHRHCWRCRKRAGNGSGLFGGRDCAGKTPRLEMLSPQASPHGCRLADGTAG